MEIPFNIKFRPEIESGKYKVSCGEKEARIICWNARGSNSNHIIALVGNPGESENIQRFYENGHLIADSANRHTKDLKIVIEETELFETIRKEVLKDIPKLKKMWEDLEYVGIRFFGEHTDKPVLCLHGWEITLEDLEKLPKEEDYV